MFERPHHQRIATVLQALNAPLLAQNACYFGGGTAIALRYGEFRESVDIEFLVSDVAGYRNLRQLLTGAHGMQAIFTPAPKAPQVQQVREVRADQYGIRTMLEVDGFQIKFEIVLEGRISLQTPDADGPNAIDQIAGVATLTALDMVTSKLLANSDRWADDSVFSRDLIDLAMMQPKAALLAQALEKAKQAYGSSVERDVNSAIDALQTRTGRLERCMQMMQMTVAKALLWQRIKALSMRGAPPQPSRPSPRDPATNS